MVHSKFDPLSISSTEYKTVNSLGIPVHVLQPKNLSPGQYPLIVIFHGGYLLTGASLFPDHFADWIIEYAVLHSAIIATFDYRLLPESTGLDILEDLSDSWHWIYHDLPGFLSKAEGSVEADLDRIIVFGGSAGGYLSIQSALLQYSPNVKAAVAAYPMIDLKAPFFTEHFPKSIFGIPEFPINIVDEHLASVKKGTIVTSSESPARRAFTLASIQHGKLLEFLGKNPELFPLETVETLRGKVPPIFIFHGSDDSAVPVDGTKVFSEKMARLHPKAAIYCRYEPGDHGLDMGLPLETPWLKDILDRVTEVWLG